MDQPRGSIGVIISSSLTEGLTARVDAAHQVEALRFGQFLLVAVRQHKFFALLTNVKLAATAAAVLADPPADDLFLQESLCRDVELRHH